MPTAVAHAVLEVAPLFGRFTDKERSELWNVALESKFDAGEYLVQRGQQAQKLFVLAQGTAEVLGLDQDDETEVLATLTPPCSFGELPFFESSAHQVAVRALTPVHVVMIDRDGLNRLLQRGSLAAYKLAHSVLLTLADRLRRLDQWIAQKAAEAGSISPSDWRYLRQQLYQEWRI